MLPETRFDRQALEYMGTVPMPQTGGSAADTAGSAEQYLRRYLLDSRMLQAELRRQERNEMVRQASGVRGGSDESGVLFCRARMYEVQEFIRGLPDCEEKLFLYQHYICGDSVPRIAEELDISDRSAYRLRRRALDLAERHYRERMATTCFMAMRI